MRNVSFIGSNYRTMQMSLSMFEVCGAVPEVWGERVVRVVAGYYR